MKVDNLLHVKLLRLGTSRSPVDIPSARRDPDRQLLLQQLLVLESLISSYGMSKFPSSIRTDESFTMNFSDRTLSLRNLLVSSSIVVVFASSLEWKKAKENERKPQKQKNRRKN